MPVASREILTPRDLRRIASVVHEHCGINLHEGKQELVQARMTKLLRHSRFGTVGEYLDHALEFRDGPEFASLIDSLSTNLTSFFREGDHFQYLGREFLPTYVRTRGPEHTTVRGWSAACSSGEEPYSIAAVLQEYIEESGGGLSARVLATDISHRMLATARAGRYDRRRLVPVPPPYRRFFQPVGNDPRQVEPSPEIRNMVRFAHLNLMEPWPFTGPLDFIFCRNVMIYFDKPTQQRLIDRFLAILAPGGVLFTGHSESLTGIAHGFEYVRPTIYVKPARS